MSSLLAYVAFLIALGLAGFAAWLREQPAPLTPQNVPRAAARCLPGA